MHMSFTYLFVYMELIFLLIIYNILIYNISAPKIIPTPICPFLMKKLKEVISLYDSSITPRAKG